MDKEKLKSYFYSNVATIFWSSFLLVGGGIFVAYYAHIEYMPDFDLKSSVAVTAAAAVTALIIMVVLLVVMILPGAFWGNTWGAGSRLKNHWNDSEGNRTILGLTIWFAVPLAAVYAGALSAFSIGWYGAAIPSLVFLGYFAYITSSLDDLLGSAKESLYQVGATLVASLFLFLPLWLVLGLSIYDNAALRVPSWLAGIMSGVFVLFVNVLAATNPKNIKPFYWYLGLAAATLFVVFSVFEKFHRIPVRVMELYKFGNILTSEIVLKKEACDSFKALGLEVDDTSTDLCVAKEVLILSRLGKETYLQHDKEELRTSFTVASSDILSWAIRKRQNAGDDASNESAEPTRDEARVSR